MFDKYFGFLRSHDEDSIVNSLLEHSRVDLEELLILQKMFNVFIKTDAGDLAMLHDQIQNVNNENVKIFETVTDHIIQSNFDFQKQYDLLRLQQRIDSVSGLIIATSRQVLILQNINAVIPNQLHAHIQRLLSLIIDSQHTFISSVEKFQTSRRDVIKLIHKAEEQEIFVENARSESIEILFKLANDNQLKMGDLSCIQGLINYIENISHSIKSATTSLDWLLLN